jgi:hypothetical protein
LDGILEAVVGQEKQQKQEQTTMEQDHTMKEQDHTPRPSVVTQNKEIDVQRVYMKASTREERGEVVERKEEKEKEDVMFYLPYFIPEDDLVPSRENSFNTRYSSSGYGLRAV